MNLLASNPLNSNIFCDRHITTTSQIVFIDSQVIDYRILVNGVIDNTEVVILDSNQNGIEQISRVLNQKAYSTVHIVSHGSPGCLYLGNTQLSLDTLHNYAQDLKNWFPSSSFLVPRSSLLIYGCNVAAGDAGEEFISKLNSITGAEIAASTTPIGNADKGGNWELDFATSKESINTPFTLKSLANYSDILVSGRVFDDISNDGADDSEAGVSGVTVRAYDSSGNLAETTTSDGTGAYSFTTLTNGEPYRIEFDLSTLPSGYLEGFIGTDSDGSLTFANGGDTGIDFGVSEKPLDNALVRTYRMAVTCGVDETSDYVFALTNAPSLAYSSTTYNSSNGLQEFHHEDWTLEKIGNIYFTEFDSRGNIFAPASRFTENSDFSGGIQQYGSIGGSDAIYKMDAITGAPTEWATLPQAGGGNSDAGMGGITYDPSTDSMYVVNMHDNTIYRITGSDNATGTVEADTYTPSLGTSTHSTGATFQNTPFGLDIYNGRLYYTVHDAGNDVDSANNTGSLVVRSVGLNADGTINTGDDQEEIREVMSVNYNGTIEGYPVVADIDFSPTGQMAISSFSSGPVALSGSTPNVNYYNDGNGQTLYNHTASNYIYELSGGTWGRTVITSVGQETYSNATPNATATGGIAWDPNAGSQETLWMSGGDFAGEDGEWGVIGYNSTQLDNTVAQEDATDYIQFLFPSQNTSDPKGNGGEVDVFGFAMSIGNRIWDDADTDGIQDANETGLANITVSLYNSSGTKVGEVDTDAEGKYIFDNSNVTLNGATGVVPNSDYEVRLEDGIDFTGKSLTISDVLGDDDIDSDAVDNSGTPTISLTTGDPGENNYTYDIGLVDGTLSTTYDYGDAPDTVSGTATGDYQTTASDGGAAHRTDLTASTLYIGTSVDSDDGTQQNIAADADDTLDGSDDENGVTFTFVNGSTLRTDNTTISADVTVFNNTGSDATLVGWIDFDRSGTFDSDEAVATTLSSSPTASTPTLTWNSSNGLPNDITEGTSYARFRLSTDSALNTSTSIGTASDGEVEDYQIAIDGVDYGDAPDDGISGNGAGDYNTLSSNSGASHIISGDLALGSSVTSVDSDNGTQQDTGATADDADDGNDDEDGVTFPTTLHLGNAGSTYSVSVDYANTGAAATLVGWIDFDQDGLFESSEGVSQSLTGTGSTTLIFNVPNDTTNDFKSGTTYARFRVSRDSGFGTGNSIDLANDGEVEDYQITVNEADFGDAPDDGDTANGAGEYDTFRSNNGPSHGIVSGLSIGSVVDAETDAAMTTTDATATGDDNTDSDDEDGVTFTSTLASDDTSYSVDVDVTNTTGSDALLTGWIDFDQSGTFDTDESVSATFSSSGTQTLTWNSLPGLVESTTYARFRLTETIFSENFDSYTTPVDEAALGWSIDPNTSDTAFDDGDGRWIIDDPVGHNRFSSGGAFDQLEANSSPHALVTGSGGGNTDVDHNSTSTDDGVTTIDSPDFTLPTNASSIDLSLQYYLSTNETDSNDNFTIELRRTSDNVLLGSSALLDETPSGQQTGSWTEFNSSLLAHAGETAYLRFIATDGSNDSVIEAGVDDINITYTPNPIGALDSGEVEDYQLTVQGVDYGDAPDTVSGTATGDYETTSANGGASHIIDNDILIGTTIDADDGTQQSTAADADDTLDSADDEDGFTNPLTALDSDATSYSLDNITVKNDTGVTATLIGWIDFDRDGVFSSDEATTTTVGANAGVTTANLVWNSIPSDITDGTTYARFRFSTDETLTISSSTGQLSDGEVEDYQITINGIDYGDAPDDGVSGNSAGDYNTLSSNSGASHIISGDLALGSSVTSVDADTGTQQNTGATSDDTTDGNDDEDGVSFPNTLSLSNAGSTYDVTVSYANTGAAATLVGWIDFNQNGLFESSEGVSTSVSGTGSTNLSFNVPSDTVNDFKAGTTYARFRITRDSDFDTLPENNPTGSADDGEVEDYAITIEGGTDYGDAPDDGTSGNSAGDYNTLSATGGASHEIISGLSIGSVVDAETDANTNVTATGDDTTDSDDEDGVTFTEGTVISKSDGDDSYSVEVIVNAPPANVTPTTIASEDFASGNYSSGSGWSGNWTETQDDNIVSTGDIQGDNGRLEIKEIEGAAQRTIDLSSTTGDITLEFDYQLVDDNTGDGFVINASQHPLLVQIDNNDGNGFQTVATFNSSSINPSSGVQSVSLDISSSVTNRNANTQIRFLESNGSTWFDGEEGYGIDNIEIIEDVPDVTTLVGWVDFDRDGIFQTDEAQTLSTADSSLNTDGTTANTLTWTGINSQTSAVTPGDTYARFRLSNDSNLSSSTPDDSVTDITDGEVEDYLVTIKNEITGSDSAENTTGTDDDDLFIANKGEDTLTGGAGKDCYYFNETSDGIDTITDFTVTEDQIDLSAILADEVTAYISGDPFAQGYVELVEFTHPISGITSTIVQIDFDAGDESTASDLYHKDIAILQGVALSSLDTSRDFVI